MNFDPKKYSDKILLELYEKLLRPRMIEEKMLLLLRQGKITKWFAGIGQEAIAIGCTMALTDDEYILPMHRNLGVFTTRNVPLDRLFMQLQGKDGGFSKGRERSFHFGIKEHNIVGMISHLGPQLGLADGIALAHQMRKEKKVCIVFTGEGGTSEGDFHEALNLASVWDLPVIFVIENNGYGLSTPIQEQYRAKKLSDKGVGYGMDAYTIDGNNVLEVYDTVLKHAKAIRNKPHPVLLECMTFRMRGHEEASGTKYIPPKLFEEWGQKDPIETYENYLLESGKLKKSRINSLRFEFGEQIDQALEAAFAAPAPSANEEVELSEVYAPFTQKVEVPATDSTSEKRLVDAISDGLRQSLQKHENLLIMGQDIAEYGGVFKITEGFVQEFGRERIRNTPICESAVIGAGLGLSVNGYKSVVEMQFADFITSGFNQVVNNLAKNYYRWGQNADVVLRMPTGAGVGAGPFHSQSNEAWFFHTPGLKILYPAFPSDAKGLLCAAIEDPNPVLFFEHKALYRAINEEVPDDYYTLEIGKARLLRQGESVSIITYGAGVHWALATLDEHPDISADLLDLRSLAPLDWDAIRQTASKTGKVIILHEDTLIGGIGGEISAYLSEHLFEQLDAPVLRCAALDTPVPFANSLEEQFLPKGRFSQQLLKLLDY